MPSEPLTTAQASSELYKLTWPLSDLGEAIPALAKASGLVTHPLGKKLAWPGGLPADEQTLDQWIDWGASQLGLEAEPMAATYAEIDQFLHSAGPALLQWPRVMPIETLPTQEPRFLLLVRSRYARLTLIGPDRALHQVRPRLVRSLLCNTVATPQQAMVDQLLQDANISEQRRAHTRAALFRELAGRSPLRGFWCLRLTPAADLKQQSQRLRLPQAVGQLLISYLGQLLLTLLAWGVISQIASSGDGTWTWRWGWALLLLTQIPFVAWSNNAQDAMAVGLGQIFKQRLLYGALRLEAEEVRQQGVGQFLGRVLETELLEQLALTGGFTLVLALLQLSAALVVLTLGAGGWSHALLLFGWLLLMLLFVWRYWRRRRTWINTYRTMTNDVVERMVGHRTRLAQEDRQTWHAEEDQLLDQYLNVSTEVDKAEAPLKALIARGWMVVGLGGLAYSWLFMPDSPGLFLVSLGGILLGLQALTNLMTGLQSVIGALLAWQQVGPLFQAAARATDTPSQDASLYAINPAARQEQPTFLLARDLHFRYQGRSQPILQGCNLQIQRGDRLLLEGPSGGGKSTLAALLAGLRKPETGLLLLWGFDHKTLGSNWRQRVVVAPQFHENYVLTGTLAFNLLLGRRWPPHATDLADAEVICRELGLSDLLDRMPAGLQQIVGESGWQLSHGERSRLYIARTLLQAADLLILDESFAALDPENLRLALQCVLRHAPTLLVIAHP